MDETNNFFPSSGTPKNLDTQSIPLFPITFVVVNQNNLTGEVTTDTMDEFLDLLLRMHPIGKHTSQLRLQTYTTNLKLSNTGSGWSELLSELDTVRNNDAGGSSQYYYGVVKVDYQQGVAGVGYIPSSANNSGFRTAIGWDYLTPASSGSYVLAHELGHNFGREHAPCGNVADADPLWPKESSYSNGKISAYGFDRVTKELIPTTYFDLMGYCEPQWISDYTYKNVLAFRKKSSLGKTAGDNSERPQVWIWGRYDSGRFILEPAFQTTMVPLPPEPGPYRLEGIDAQGQVVFFYDFQTTKVADLLNHEHFSFSIDRPADYERILTLRVRDDTGILAQQQGTAAIQLQPAKTHTVLQWHAESYPLVVIRDHTTGAILALARGGTTSFVATPGAQLTAVLSDGVQSETYAFTNP